ncbi:MAG: NfeD family protein [Rhodospirillales bacterium]|nr:NfeD family protein [Rhodospirillales bacterium]
MIDPGLIWIGAGLVLMALEVLHPGGFLIWLGVAGLATGAITLAVPLGFAGEASVFAFAAVIAVALGIGLRRRRHPVPDVNTQAAGLVGRRARALAFEGREGRVRVGDSDWPARLLAGEAPPDARLTVIAVDGMTLLVAPEVEATS